MCSFLYNVQVECPALCPALYTGRIFLSILRRATSRFLRNFVKSALTMLSVLVWGILFRRHIFFVYFSFVSMIVIVAFGLHFGLPGIPRNGSSQHLNRTVSTTRRPPVTPPHILLPDLDTNFSLPVNFFFLTRKITCPHDLDVS